MFSDRLYKLAFEFKKTKLWQTLWDADVFAVKLSGDRMGYISIMGAAGKHCALALYFGNESLDSFRTLAGTDRFMMSASEVRERVLQQECLQCSFEGKDELSEEERESVKEYARVHGIRLGGKNAYPQFMKYQRNRCPWSLQAEEEQKDLCEALEAAIALAGLLERSAPEELGLKEIGPEETEIPLMERCEGEFVLRKTLLPEQRPLEMPAAKAGNEIAIAKLKKIKRAGALECGILRVQQPVQNTPEEIPFFPVLLLAVDSVTERIVPLHPVKDYEDNPEALMDVFMEGLLREKFCPGEIFVRDERTYVFMKAFCEKLGIGLIMEEELEALDEAEDMLLDHLDMQETEEMTQFDDMLNILLDLDESQLRLLPPEMLRQLKLLADQDVLPARVEEKLKQVFALLEKGDAPRKKSVSNNIRKMASTQSYVISVSLGSGCYRHIRIGGGNRLFDLHAAILDAFGFADDHAHAFFMDNCVWSDRDSYYAEDVESGLRTTSKYRLGQVDLYKGKQFKYVFDFGDEWTFQCRVLRVEEGGSAEPEVIRSKGEAPPQYGSWDDEWEDEDE